MNLPAGVSIAQKKDKTQYFRASITYKNKHISLGSFHTPEAASAAYLEASAILSHSMLYSVDTSSFSTSYSPNKNVLSFEKWIILINYKDSGFYFKTPIYLCKKYFIYFLNEHQHLIFDVDDLFYYSHHKIMSRNGYLFVNDYGLQTNILSRYGIRNHSVANRDYFFVNGDPWDFRYSNILVINKYFGVQQFFKKGRLLYKVKIHVNGDFVVGTYLSEKEAAIAYNKAADLLISKGFKKNFPKNYVLETNPIEYATIYNSVKISNSIRQFTCC